MPPTTGTEGPFEELIISEPGTDRQASEARGVLDQGQGLGRRGVGIAAQVPLPAWPAQPLHPWVLSEHELQGDEGASSGAEELTAWGWEAQEQKTSAWGNESKEK